MNWATGTIEQEWKLEQEHTITLDQDVVQSAYLAGDDANCEDVAMSTSGNARAGSSSGINCLTNLDSMTTPQNSKEFGDSREEGDHEPRVKCPRVTTQWLPEAIPFQLDNFSSWQSEQSDEGCETDPMGNAESRAGKAAGRGPIHWPSTTYTSSSCDWDELSLVTSNGQHDPSAGAKCPCDHCIWWREHNPSKSQKGKGRGKRSYYSTM